MVLVRELKKHFPARAPEWINSFTMSAWGAYVLLHPEVFEQPYFTALADLAWADHAATFWGMTTLLVGTARSVALLVNGAYSRTPIIRLVASLASAFVWSQIVIGIWLLGQPSTGLVMYGSAVVVDLISSYRAASDVAIAESTRLATRAGAQKSGNTGKHVTVGGV